MKSKVVDEALSVSIQSSVWRKFNYFIIHTMYATIKLVTLKANFQENQKKMQKHIYWEQIIGWTLNRFQEEDKVQRFYLMLTGEPRLWYESLIWINADWTELQNSFRQQYSKIGNTREQLFHAWRSFHFDENRNNRYLCTLYKTGCHTLRLWGTTNIRSFQKYPSYKVILGSFPSGSTCN